MGYFDGIDFEDARKSMRARMPPEQGDFSRGLKESFQQLPQLGYGLMAGAGAALENVTGEGGIATGIKRAGVEGYTKWGDKIAADAKESDSLTYSYDRATEGDFGAMVDWMQHALGYAVGQGGQMLLTGGVGALVGKMGLQGAAQTLAGGMVRKQAAEIASGQASKMLGVGATEAAIATKAAELAATPAVQRAAVSAAAARIGQTAAIGASAYGMEGGEIFGDMVQQAEKEGRQVSGADLGRALGATMAAGSLEFVGDKLGLDVMLGRSALLKPAQYAKNLGGRVARGAVAGAGAAVAEGGTEYLQTGLEEYGKGTEASFLPMYQSEQNQRQAIDAAGIGAVSGAAMGGAGGLMARAKKRQADAALNSVSSAQTVDEMASAALQATDLPLSPGGMSAQQEAAALDSLDRQRAADESGLRKFGPGATSTTTRTAAAPGAPEEPSAQVFEEAFSDRMLRVREQLSDPKVTGAIRQRFGEQGLNDALYYMNLSDQPVDVVPDATRDRLLGMAEGYISRSILRPGTKRVEGPAATVTPLLEGTSSPLRIGLDTTPTGRIRVDSEGAAAPETKADVISARQRASDEKSRRDGLGTSKERGQSPAIRLGGPLPVGETSELVPTGEATEIQTIPVGETSELMPTAEATELPKRIPAGVATDLEVETIRPGDLLTSDNEPYGTRASAAARATRDGGGEVVKVDGGFVVRKVGDEPVGNVAGPAAGAAEAAAGRGDQSGRGGGTVRPAPVAQGAVVQASEASATGGRAAAPVADAGISHQALTKAAHEAATSPRNDLPEPTDAQKEAGNYRKGHVTLAGGVDVSIENPAGSVRRSKAGAAHSWQVVMPYHYGYVKGTIGVDKDHVDIAIGPKGDNGRYWVINQTRPDSKTLDEHKIFTGVDSAVEAIRLYKASFADGFGDKVFGSVSSEFDVDQLKQTLPEMGKRVRISQPQATVQQATTPPAPSIEEQTTTEATHGNQEEGRQRQEVLKPSGEAKAPAAEPNVVGLDEQDVEASPTQTSGQETSDSRRASVLRKQLAVLRQLRECLTA